MKSSSDGLALRRLGVSLFFTQSERQQPVAVITLNLDMFDRARKLNHFFETAVSDFKLIVRNAFSAGTVTARSAHSQNIAIDGDFDVAWFDARQIDFHDPAIRGAVDIRGRTPQATRRPAVSIVAKHTEITFKRFAGHSDNSVSKTFEGKKGIRLK